MLEPEQEKSFLDSNTILAVVLSFGIFVLWQMYMNKKYPPQSANPTVAEKSAGEAEDSNVAETTDPVENSGVNSSPGAAPTPVGPVATKPETLVAYDGENFRFNISSHGMGLKDIALKTQTDRKGAPIQFSWTAEEIAEEVSQQEASTTTTVATLNKKIKAALQDGNFSTQYEGKPVEFDVRRENENTFVGRGTFSRGEIIKTIVLDDRTYSAKIEVQTRWTQPEKTAIQTVILDKIKNEKASWFSPSYEGTDFVNVAEGGEERERLVLDQPFTNTYKNVTLAGISSQYFALVIKDHSDIMPQVKSELLTAENVGIAQSTLMHRPTNSDVLNISYTIFMGPKSYDLLTSVEPEMAAVINFGYFGFIAKPMLHVLKFLYAMIGNWGVAIIILTLVVRLCLFPVAMSSMRSMKRMQKIQPKLKVLKEKYKDDAAKMNQETMALMKAEGANPIGGCLPLLAQIPIFFALYSVLGVSVELYKAPFIFWIKDLSYQDPYFVLPVLVSLLFFAQMKLSPSQMDPTQQKVMMIMPVVFGLLMFSLPTGLMVYFITNTIFGIGQQFYINREKTTSSS